jgi:hypothetical protein
MDVPTRGEKYQPDPTYAYLPESKSEIRRRWKRNLRSDGARRRRCEKFKNDNIRRKVDFKNLKILVEKNLTKSESKKELNRLRKVRQSCAREPSLLGISNSLQETAQRGVLPLFNNGIHRKNHSIFNPRSIVKVSTFNARTLSSFWRQCELVHYCIRHSIHILCIQEHKIFYEVKTGDDPIRRKNLGKGWHFIFTSCVKSTNGVIIGGVGVIVCPKIYHNICSVTSHNSRIIQLVLGNNSQFKSHILCIYSPTSAAARSDVEDFYNFLSTTIESIPISDMTIIAGDFNAMAMTGTYHENLKFNRNSSFFKDFILENEFISVNSMFRKRKRYTFYGMNNRKVILDYILVRKKWCRSVVDSIIGSPLSVASDHCMISAKIRWKFKSTKPYIVTRKDYSFIKNKENDPIRRSNQRQH